MLSEFCVRRPVSATMLVMSLVVLGLFSFRDLGVDLFPKADPATVSVELRLPGASPDEISTAVVEPMEEAISGVSGIDEIQARISEGNAWITVRFVLERDLNDAANDVREKVAQLPEPRIASTGIGNELAIDGIKNLVSELAQTPRDSPEAAGLVVRIHAMLDALRQDSESL